MMKETTIEKYIAGIPKAELHLHIEGSFEPEQMFHIANRNKCTLRFSSVEQLKNAYNFNNLQEFLDIYYEGASVLINEVDFYELAAAYLNMAKEQNVKHAEIFFDPQTHTARGISFETVFNGLHAAFSEAERQSGITFRIIMCFLRHLDEKSAMETLDIALSFRDKIAGVGLDSSEIGHPPAKFKNVFARARELGFITVAHAGEEGPVSYIRGALDLLQVSRIDHGNRSLDDAELLKELALKQVPLTICPLSNLKLAIVNDLKLHPLKKLMDAGLLVTVNSDDPAYFGGYVNENFLAIQQALDLSKADIDTLALNSFKASFIPEQEKERHIKSVREYSQQYSIIS